jgi:hypothetical protein
MTESDQCVRHSDQMKPCLICSHSGSENMREPGSMSMQSLLERERAARHVSQEVIQDKPVPCLPTFASYFAGVMQDKGIPHFVAEICTTPLTSLITRRRDMYYIYIFFRQYIVYLHLYLVY